MRTKSIKFLFSLMIVVLALVHIDSVYANNDTVTRKDMLNVAKEIHPPGCTDSMTADYCMLSTAYDTRAEIYELLRQGNNKEEVLNILVDKYGERILASPVKEGFQLISWLLPGIAILIGILVVIIFIRKWIKPRLNPEKEDDKEVSQEMENQVQKELKNWL